MIGLTSHIPLIKAKPFHCYASRWAPLKNSQALCTRTRERERDSYRSKLSSHSVVQTCLWDPPEAMPITWEVEDGKISMSPRGSLLSIFFFQKTCFLSIFNMMVYYFSTNHAFVRNEFLHTWFYFFSEVLKILNIKNFNYSFVFYYTIFYFVSQ